MTPEHRELLRVAIMETADSAKPFAVDLRLLLIGVRTLGLRSVSSGEVLAEADYLDGKGLLERCRKVVSPEMAGWKITAAGRDWLAEEGHG